MLDYIPRSAALEAIEEERKAAHWDAQDMPCLGSCHDEYIVTRTLERVAMRLQSIPAADVHDDVHGKWVYDKNATDWGIGGYICSECKNKNNNLPCNRVKSVRMFSGAKFCPNCGAKMDKEE